MLERSWDASRFDSAAPSWCPEVHRWTDIRPRDMSWGYVFDPHQPTVRRHIRHADWVVRFADGRVRVMTPDEYTAFRALPAGSVSPQE